MPGKRACPVLRGRGRSNALPLPDPNPAVSRVCGTRKPRQGPVLDAGRPIVRGAEMPEPARPAELAHRHPVLEPDPRTRGQSGLPLNAAAVNEPQLDTGTSGLHPPRRSRQNGHHTQDDPEPGKLQWQDTPDEQDSLAKRKINCHRTVEEVSVLSL